MESASPPFPPLHLVSVRDRQLVQPPSSPTGLKMACRETIALS